MENLMRKNKDFKRLLAVILITLFGMVITVGMIACSESSSTDQSSSSESDTQNSSTEDDLFPRSLAVVSPFDMVVTGESASLTFGDTFKAIGSTTTSRYDQIIEDISDILDAGTAGLCTFNPDLFTSTTTNANCYGPTVTYVGHPDGTPSSGDLPSGDVGIWMATADDGNACAAAQLNARMKGIRDRTKAALMGLATIVCAINTDSSGVYELPDNSTTTVTNIMPTPTGVSWNLATMTHATVSSEDKYSYILDFDYNGNNIYIDMVHIPDSDPTNLYRGRFSYQISETVSYGGNCPSNEVTRNGSLVYNRTSSSKLVIESKDAQFCGLEADGFDNDGIVDETMKYDVSTEPNGWANDFNLLRAEFDPATQLGDYAYAWQAGMGDGNVRAFNMKTSDDGIDTTEDLSATAFFGYGKDIESDDPAITGFIGNWAGPGNSHSLLEKAQKQVVDFNSTTRKFDSTTANIKYAPTNSLDHPGSPFAFDSDDNGSTDYTTAFTNELASGTDTDGDSNATIKETIAAAGISVPSAPTCSNCGP
jgi:hypothetical protein